MRAVCFWLIIAALSALLLFLSGPIALTILGGFFFAVAIALYAAPHYWAGLPFVITSLVFAAPLVAVAMIFGGTYRSLRG